jgi:pilus assembly protein CpaB
MNRARVLVLLVAIGCAVLAALLARGMMSREPSAPVAEAPRATVPVLVAVKDIAIGERITPVALEWRDWPRENLASFMITREAKPNAITEFEGVRARAQILLGEPIAERKILAAESGGLMSTLVRDGLRGLAIRISNRSAGSGFILPNDRVDVIATIKVTMKENPEGEDRIIVFSRTIVSNVRVLAVNQTLAASDDNPSLDELETAVLELDPQQAEIVARSETQGELSLALRSLGEAADGDSGDQGPTLASNSDIPNRVEVYKQGLRFIFSCEPGCDPAMQMVNAPFPLIVRDVGVEQTSSNR